MSLIAILTLAVGLGVNTVAFSAVNALVFKDFHVADADRVGWVLAGGRNGREVGIDISAFRRIERASQTTDAIAATVRTPLAYSAADATEEVWALAVSEPFFDLVPADLLIGRGLSRADLAGGDDAPAVVVSERFWRRRLGAAANLSGVSIEINRTAARVVGVMRDGYQTPTGVFEPDLYIGLEPTARLGGLSKDTVLDSTASMMAMARPGIAPGAVGDGLAAAVAATLNVPVSDVRLEFVPVRDRHPEARAIGRVASVALLAVGVVLLIACFNVAGLLLAQSSEQQREIGMRAALGASRWRLVRQLLTDAAVLAAAAGAAALLLARWSAALLGTFSLPAPIPQRLHFTMDWHLVAFGVALSLVAAVVPALAPAWQVWRADLTAWVRRASGGGSGTPAERRAQRGFLWLQVAGSTVFLITAAAFISSFLDARAFNPGFDLDHTAALEIAPAHYGYAPAEARALVEDATTRMAALPGVAAATAADRIPFFVGYPQTMQVSTRERDCRTSPCVPARLFATDSAHASALALSLGVGRWLDARNPNDRDAVVISSTAARVFWPNSHPIGETFRDETGRDWHVVGVVNDVTTSLIGDRPPDPTVYRLLDTADFARPVTLVARTNGDPAALADSMRRVLHDLAPAVPAQAGTMRQRMALPLWPVRTLAGFFGICGLLAALLATVGLFGVTHFIVGRRTREFGVRLAIGASGSGLQRMVIGETLRLVAPGIAAGVLLGVGLTRVVQSSLSGMGSAAPGVVAIALAIELGMALAAAWLPARRAASTEPVAALRAE
jgi:predicted permease